MVSQDVERADKLEVEDAFVLPDLEDLVPVGGRWESTDQQLVSTYFDTASCHLMQFGVTLRRRQGGSDGGWHLKMPHGDARVEISDASTASKLPTSLARLTVGVQAGEDLGPVARLSVARTVHRLYDQDGALLVELADDRVEGSTTGDAGRSSVWREVEVELKGAGDERLLKAVSRRLRGAGARRSRYSSKLQRTLGSPARARTAPDLDTTGGLAWAYIAEQAREITTCDIRLRLDEPVVHGFRVAIRRLRSTLRVFAPLFDQPAAEQLDAELTWFAGLLGGVRDREVLLERLAQQLGDLPADVVLGPVAAHIEATLLGERAQHQEQIAEAMDGDRYAALMKAVLSWLTRPPLTGSAAKPAKNAARYIRDAEKKVEKRLREADGDIEALHGARKAAKRHRYALELAGRRAGKKGAQGLSESTRLQTLLGEHQDSVVSAEFLRRLGARAGTDNDQNGFTYGLLLAQEWQRAQRAQTAAARRWGKKPR